MANILTVAPKLFLLLTPSWVTRLVIKALALIYRLLVGHLAFPEVTSVLSGARPLFNCKILLNEALGKRSGCPYRAGS